VVNDLHSELSEFEENEADAEVRCKTLFKVL